MPQLIKIGPPPAPTLKPEWNERTLLFRGPGGTVVQADGMRLGTLHVHPTLDAQPVQGFAVTHAPSKLAVAIVDGLDDAIAVAERLWQTCAAAFVQVDREPDKSKIPSATVEWIKRCNRSRRLEP